MVAAASYEARKFGVRSAMPSVTAKRLCPDLIFCKSRFDVYREVSRQIRAIFHHHTELVEPLSLDEAYLDVTEDKLGIGSATRIAELIRQEIRAKTKLTASAGVSYNKFLAKLASDQNKPDGLCVIRPGQGAEFVAGLPVRRFHGVGPRGAEKMAKLGIATGADLASKDIAFLRQNFGSFADYLYRAARGIDLQAGARAPDPQIGRRRAHLRGGHLLRSGPAGTLEDIIEIVWGYIERAEAKGRTVTLKLKFTDFQIMSRARSVPRPIAAKAEFARLSRELLDEVLPLPLPIRLMGLTLSKLEQEGHLDEPRRPDAQLSLL